MNDFVVGLLPMVSTKRRGLGSVEIAKPRTDLRVPVAVSGGDQFDRLKSATNMILSEVGKSNSDLPKTGDGSDFGKTEDRSAGVSTKKRASKKTKQKSKPLSQRREQVTKNGRSNFSQDCSTHQ